MNSKTFFGSKLNWLGIFTFLAGIGAVADKLPPTALPWITVVVGFATVILRTFFTSQPIGNAS